MQDFGRTSTATAGVQDCGRTSTATAGSGGILVVGAGGNGCGGDAAGGNGRGDAVDTAGADAAGGADAGCNFTDICRGGDRRDRLSDVNGVIFADRFGAQGAQGPLPAF